MSGRVRWLAGVLVLGVGVVGAFLWFFGSSRRTVADPRRSIPSHRPHLDHASFFPKPLQSPQDATRACLECHPRAASEVMRTAHWQWQGEPVVVAGHPGKHAIGKRNLLNNFCLGIRGNWAGCTSCHAGYGWRDANFDFSRQENVDCLVCHDGSGTYVKGDAGLPAPGTDLTAVARSVGVPTRQNCGVCHIYGGGGMGVKHGDLDDSLLNPQDALDVHMGRHNMLCVDCHRTRHHQIPGTAFSVSVAPVLGVACTDCHDASGHRDERLNRHSRSLACTTCHVPSFARKVPTKMTWDWSKAGDDRRSDDPHHYLKIKGEFVYRQDVVPEYRWFNRRVGRYLLGDPIDPRQVTVLNPPQGDRNDAESRIWPFKVHRARQPYDAKFNTLLQPVLSGPKGYWREFDWPLALSESRQYVGLPFSGEYGFAETEMLWPISHMTAPKEKALSCGECHETRRFDWQALGYAQDPIRGGGRFSPGDAGGK